MDSCGPKPHGQGHCSLTCIQVRCHRDRPACPLPGEARLLRACLQTAAHSTGEPGTAGRWGTQQAQSQAQLGTLTWPGIWGICTIKHFYSPMSWS